MTLENLSVRELEELKALNFAAAERDGAFEKLGAVARYLGTSLNVSYGPKYRWQCGAVQVYLDCYGGVLTATLGGKHVAWKGNRLFIPGDWFQVIEDAYPYAIKTRDDRKAANEERLRRELIAELEAA
jgi:hypothetical protein